VGGKITKLIEGRRRPENDRRVSYTKEKFLTEERHTEVCKYNTLVVETSLKAAIQDLKDTLDERFAGRDAWFREFETRLLEAIRRNGSRS
jgi:hypothetical protein